MEKGLLAFADLGKGRTHGKIVKPNKKTTIIDFNPQNFSREDELYHMHNGISLQSHKEKLQEQGLTRPGRVKRHNSKHNVVFI